MSRRRLLLVLAALALAAGMPAAATSSATSAEIDPRLTAALALADGPVEVVVTFEGDAAPSAVDVQLLRDVGITTGFTFTELPIAGVLATAEQVAALAARPEVASLWANQPLEYELDESRRMIGVDALRADPEVTARNGGKPVDGAGVGVVINDSGIDGLHRDLEYPTRVVQNVLAATNLNAWSELLPVTYVEDVAHTDATGGHGTHVAGIAGGSGVISNGKYAGVAAGAALVGYGSGAGLAILDVLGGFDYAIANRKRYGIRAINNSWGSTGDVCTDVNPNDPITRATYEAYRKDIVVVFSAGNSGRNGPCTITGNYKKAPWVISVAASDKSRNLADFSSRGSRGGGGTFKFRGKTWTWEDRPTLTAPGVLIAAARTVSPIGATGTVNDTQLLEPEYWPYYTHLSGTSMAAPHVAGAVALVLEANPKLKPLDVKALLESTASPLPYEAWEVGAGFLDAHAAVRSAFQG